MTLKSVIIWQSYRQKKYVGSYFMAHVYMLYTHLHK